MATDYRSMENQPFLALFKVYEAVMKAYRWETDEEADAFNLSQLTFAFTDAQGNKTEFTDVICPYNFEAFTDACEATAEQLNDENDIYPWLKQMFDDVKNGVR